MVIPGKGGLMRRYAKVEAISNRSAQRSVRRITLLAGSLVLANAFSIFVACSTPEGPKQANAAPQAAAADWKAVEQALGKAGSMQPGDVYKVSMARSDLQVPVN